MTFKTNRRHAARALAVAVALAGTGFAAFAHDADDGDEDRGGLRSGKLFISSNARAGNEVLVYQRATSGPATLVTRVATQGQGTGAGLGSQGAVTLSGNGRWLFVVNAASNSLSTFAVTPGGLVLKSVVDTGGLTPTSVTEHEGLVFVLNAGGSGNVTGLRNRGGQLTPVLGAVGTLSANTGTAPGQVSFNEDGDVLVVTERATNRLTSFAVKRDGTLDGKTVTASAGAVPFGFAFTRRDTLVVSEAAGSGASSYRFNERSAQPILVTPSLANGQGAACWVAVTPDGKFAFTANAATSTVSSYAVARNGQLSLQAGVAASTGTGAGALDMAVSPGGSQLAVFANRSLNIVSFSIARNGVLVPLGSVGGMPAGSAGLAAN
jgi:6-phosphogluconolactonase (cycloisomerase 2 family)